MPSFVKGVGMRVLQNMHNMRTGKIYFWISLLICVIIFQALSIKAFAFSSDDIFLQRWHEFSLRAESKKLSKWMRKNAFAVLSGNRCTEKLNIETPEFYGRLGLFITLKKKNRVRGCYGSFMHKSMNIERVLLDYLKGALRHDIRHEPLDITELEFTEIIITITSQPRQIDSIYSVDLYKFGVLVRCDGINSRVYVPAEIRSTSFLRRIMGKKSCNISEFRAVTLKG